jgi:hypothetical protein
MNAFTELERSVLNALETYSTVHRGSGHNSLITTQWRKGHPPKTNSEGLK